MTQAAPKITTHILGFPRIGKNRELKKALEAYWKGKISSKALLAIGRDLRISHWELQKNAGLNFVCTGDFAWYDQVLTLSATLGNIPARHRKENIINAQHEHTENCCHEHQHHANQQTISTPDYAIDLDTLFRVARGTSPSGSASSASDMTKWFDTNYHYIVPEFHAEQTFDLCWTQIIDETKEAISLGYNAKPVLVGPLTYLYLGKEINAENNFSRLGLLDKLIPVFQKIIDQLADAGAEWIQIDEPILALDLPREWQQAFEVCYHRLQSKRSKILLATYFGGLEDNLSIALQLPVAGLHIDAVRSPEQILSVVDRLSAHKILSLGIIDGRNVWRNNYARTFNLIKPFYDRLAERLWLAPSCSLLHTPVDLALETKIESTLKSWLAFSVQKLQEINDIAIILAEPSNGKTRDLLQTNHKFILSRSTSPLIHNSDVEERLSGLKPEHANRNSVFIQRIQKQQTLLNLPKFPTTTIGSFPQTAEIRQVRAKYRQQEISEQEYIAQLQQEIKFCIQQQEEIDLDVLVHGEAERTDMVEYFGEFLEGFVFTELGWVQSYGSRCVKPPIIVGDVYRKQAITVEWATYAQSLSHKPVKGMLTGPITILCWSFVRDDQPRSTTAKQIALALRDEVCDLEAAGIRIIQIDEPAIREGLPLRKNAQREYLNWAVNAFRLAASGVQDETQIHTHMCYSEFNEIIQAIAALDADVITIETSRSQGELLQAFQDYQYPNDIGPGVYDIHSPNEPKVEDMVNLLSRSAQKISPERLWVNPDCGLKTRSWPETRIALQHMVTAAKKLREEFA